MPGQTPASAAAMNLWGPNTIGQGPMATEQHAATLRVSGAQWLVLYAYSRQDISAYVHSLTALVPGTRITMCGSLRMPPLGIEECIATGWSGPGTEKAARTTAKVVSQ